MSWRTEKTEQGQDLIWDGVERGIFPSPTSGTANIQNANIATETGEVMASYSRTNQSQVAISAGTLIASAGDGAILLAAPSTLKAGTWIRASASSVSSITAATNPSTVTANYLVVGGGGGGGAARNGGAGAGGAGGMLTGTNAFSVGSTLITVGGGGAGGSVFAGTAGTGSSLGAVAAASGGGQGGTGTAGTTPSSTYNGGNGGSGGGGGADDSTSGTAGTGTGGQGTNGGTGFASATLNNRAGGGGGGATSAGANGASTAGGNGGAGTASSISGASVTYAGGGGGGAVGTAGTGGAGGGGAGGDTAAGTAGTDNLGGGGGGGSDNAGAFQTGGDGGNGVVIISYTTGSMFATGGSIGQVGSNTIHTFTIPVGNSSSSYTENFTVVAIATGGLYYVSYKDTNNKVKLSAKFDPTAANAITHGTSGTVTFDTVAVPNSAIAKATEKYTTSTTTEYRYYVLDINGYVYMYDTKVYDDSLAASGVATLWMLVDPINYSTLKMTGMAVLNGWLLTISNSRIYGKKTVDLGNQFIPLVNAWLNEPFPTHNNFAMVGSQGKMLYTDGNYIGELFPTTSLVTSIANIQSYGTYTASTTTGTVTSIIGGSLPYDPGGVRIPVVFFTNQYGTLPTAITEGTVYYIRTNITSGTFNVYTALTGSSQVDVGTGATGTQYFNTFYPLGAAAGIEGTSALVQYSSQRVNLPFYETAQCLVEIGNTVIIGCNGSVLYPWNQVDATPSDFIVLPESDVRSMINVNNMAYVFAGNKGNIYITNNSVASLALKVPDYAAGVPGTPLTYIEPYFTWGDSMYVRGRVYFSILDQRSTKAGNCGGNWSFIPSQNIDPSQDVGMALRLENQNSYGYYDGVSTILIANEEQAGMISPQYWAWWQDSYNTATSAFGVDQTAATPVTTYIVETDILKSGTILAQQTYSTVEYDLTTPLATNDSVQLYYRLNSTDTWTTCGTVIEESTNKISGYFKQAFQKTQVLQFRGVITTGGTTASSFVRLKQIRLR